MGIVGEDLVGDGIHHFSILIFGETEFDEVGRFERCARYWIGAVLLQPGENVGDVEYCPLWTADRVVERLERDGAEVEWQALEGCIRGICLGRAGSDAGRKGIFGSPLTVGDLVINRQWGCFIQDRSRYLRRACRFLQRGRGQYEIEGDVQSC